MSLARRAVLAASRTKPVIYTTARAASSSSHGHHDDHHHQEDTTVYPAEGFGTTFWRNVLLISIAGVVGVKLAPSADKDVYLTRWIDMYTTPATYWAALNAKHTAQTEEQAQLQILLSDAQKPPVHRFRYPQALQQASPFLNGIGTNVDMTGVVPKQDYASIPILPLRID